MSSETLAKIFDPFFSTKFKGRGLGLAAVMGIVRAHGGALKVSSVLGEGSTFEVIFPALKTPSSGTVAVTKPERAPKKSFGRVLLVDDEPAIRSAAKVMLRYLGYEVDLGVDGLEAIEKVRARGGNYRFVLMDMTMPNVTGHDAFKIIHNQYPSLAVILMSGYSDDFAKNIFKEDQPTAFLRKPFSPVDLGKLLPSQEQQENS
jgi:CheY-like chemotaxis protein